MISFFSSRRRHTRYWRDWSSDVCSSDLAVDGGAQRQVADGEGVPGDVLPVVEVGVEDGEGVRRRPDGGGYLLGVAVLRGGPDQAEHGVPEGRKDGAELVVHPLL